MRNLIFLTVIILIFVQLACSSEAFNNNKFPIDNKKTISSIYEQNNIIKQYAEEYIKRVDKEILSLRENINLINNLPIK